MTDGVRQRNVGSETSKKPDNSAFKQQRLPAWQPVLTAKSVLPERIFLQFLILLLSVDENNRWSIRNLKEINFYFYK